MGQPFFSSGRFLLGAGLLLGLALPIAYVFQFHYRLLFVPWYLPALGTMAVTLAGFSLRWQRSGWRWLGLGFLSVLAVLEWGLVLAFRLPSYSGPVTVGAALPEFTAVPATGAPVSGRELLGSGKVAFLFFRGRW